MSIWDRCEESAKRVAAWPAWMRGSLRNERTGEAMKAEALQNAETWVNAQLHEDIEDWVTREQVYEWLAAYEAAQNAKLSAEIEFLQQQRATGWEAHTKLKERYAELSAQLKGIREALAALYTHTACYIRLNHLGDVHDNECMKMAKAALSASTGEAPTPKFDIANCQECGKFREHGHVCGEAPEVKK